MTDCGVIPLVCDQVLHGYAWLEDERMFVLYAKLSGKRKDTRKKVMAANTDKRPKRREKLR